MIKQLLCFALLLLTINQATAQDSFTVRAQRYILQYNNLAIAEQKRSGIPASVTLAQGVLETEAGKSELVCYANNHFGIKCKNDYNGPKFLHDDDAPKECFKMYKCAEDSYKDHSDYLKRNPRYSPLFALSQTDYASWAFGLKKCGYATNPQYAQRLIKIIEDFKLQEYTYSALDSSTSAMYSMAFKEDAPPADSLKNKVENTIPALNETKVDLPAQQLASAPVAADTLKIKDTAKKTSELASDTVKAEVKMAVAPVVPQAMITAISDTPKTNVVKEKKDAQFDSGKIVTINGLKGFYVRKGELLLQYAVKYNIKYAHLLEINDLPDGPVPADMVVYLERKLTAGTHLKHVVREDETLYLVSQEEGMVLKRLMVLNMLEPGDEPAIGATLELQNGAPHKPALRALPLPDLKTSPNLSYIKPTPASDFVAVKHPSPTDTVHAPIKKEVNRDTYVTTIRVPSDSTKPRQDSSYVINSTPEVRVKDTVEMAKPTLPVAAAPTQPKADSIAAQKTTASTKEDTVADDLETLKSQLDKVVYTDDSKLLPPPVKGKIDEPIKLSTTLGDPGPAKGTKAAKAEKNARGSKPAKKEKDNGKYYTIKKGDTFSSIAKKNNVPVKQLMKLNHVDAEDLQLGKKLRIK